MLRVGGLDVLDFPVVAADGPMLDAIPATTPLLLVLAGPGLRDLRGRSILSLVTAVDVTLLPILHGSSRSTNSAPSWSSKSEPSPHVTV